VIAELGHLRRDLAADGSLQRSIVEEGDVLRPRQPDHDAQAFSRRRIEKLAPWRRVGAHGIDPELGHLAEVGGDLWERRELVTLGVRRERTVGDTFDEETLVARAQKFPVRRNARG